MNTTEIMDASTSRGGVGSGDDTDSGNLDFGYNNNNITQSAIDTEDSTTGGLLVGSSDFYRDYKDDRSTKSSGAILSNDEHAVIAGIIVSISSTLSILGSLAVIWICRRGNQWKKLYKTVQNLYLYQKKL